MSYASRIGSGIGRQTLQIIALSAVLSVTYSCGSNPAGDPPPSGPAVLTVSPTHASPGETLAISGTTVDTSALASYRLVIGGQQTLLMTDTLGSVSGIAPAFFEDSTATWPSPSVTPVDIELFKDTILVGRGVGIFTSDSLIQVPGSTQKLVTNTIATVESYKSILAALPTEPGLQEQMTVGLIAGLDSLLYGRGDSSLSALLTDLQTNNPEALAFLDAIYAASGSANQSQEIADAIAAIAASLNSGSLRRSAIIPRDVRLAAMMQLSTIFKLYGDAYIHGAAQTASNISFVSGWIGFVASLAPPLAVINTFISVTAAATSLMDLIFNKLIVATLPTTLDSLTIRFDSDTLALGDTTVSTFKVFARNSPPSITAGDLLSQFLSVAGLVVPQASSLRERLLGTLNFVLGQINTALSSYHSSHPEFGYDPNLFDLYSVPIIRWEQEVTDPRLLDLHTTTASLLTANDSLFEWYSTGIAGTANVTITPAIGDDATLIPIPPFISFGGTAFGILDDSSAIVSETKQLQIQARLALQVDFAPTISQNGANVLGVKAGEISITGDTTWTAGLDVSLTVIGGGADPATGTTDANGQFTTLISLDPFSDSVEVIVIVTSSSGEFASESVSASVGQQAQFTVATFSEIIGISNDGSLIDTIFNLLSAQSYAWSPDGARAVDGGGRVYSSSGTLTLPVSSVRMLGGSFSPDGLNVYGGGFIFDDPLAAIADTFAIVSIPLDGTPMNEIYRDIQTGNQLLRRSYGRPVASHDGTSIAILTLQNLDTTSFIRMTEFSINRIDVNGGNLTRIGSQTLLSMGGTSSGFTWFPDDSKLAYALPRVDSTTRPYTRWTEIWTMNSTTGATARISPAGTDYRHSDPIVFPDGTKVLCRRQTGGGNESELVIVNASGGLNSILATYNSRALGSFALSADGTMAAYITRASTTSDWQVVIVDASTGAVIGTTTTFTNLQYLQWRP